MKVCKFCGTETGNDSGKCPSCSASGFLLKCDNCGSQFESGAYCPTCGVKFGSKPKTCPDCGCVYNSTACPDCGYLPKRRTSDNPRVTVITQASAQPEKKRKTWLWVLGWIFIFPVPVTILTSRSQKIPTWLKVLIISAVWILYLSLGLSKNKETSQTAQMILFGLV